MGSRVTKKKDRYSVVPKCFGLYVSGDYVCEDRCQWGPGEKQECCIAKYGVAWMTEQKKKGKRKKKDT